MNPRRGFFLLAFIFFSRMVGFLIFSKGFLLKRVVIPDYSVCPNGPAAASDDTHFTHTCNGDARRFKRVVWLLIDALRYDFIVYDAALDPSPPPYRNKMPFIRDLLREHPQHARIFKLIADPPTTTMQRLKALTTGSLPTFIDISSNFNSHEILEDNLLHQAKASGRNVTFMGDDTWLGLYPRLLTKAFDYPSLNVKDLHTVDNGVVANLLPELRKYDADFVVGHFLGVDHVGHTYGPFHPTMAEKLLQLNDVLRSTFASLDEDTIVFVLGDHGMTETGDHGGEGQLETDAGLLVYSKRSIFDPWQQQDPPRATHQIDLVPTTAMLMGMPIPYSNLGMVIPELFLAPPHTKPPPYQNASSGFKGRVTLDFLDVLANNSYQIGRYLTAYQQYAGGDFPTSLLDALDVRLAKARELHSRVRVRHLHRDQAELADAASAYVQYMELSREMCQGVWAKFDNSTINRGMLVLFAVLCFNVLMALLGSSAAVQSVGSWVVVGLVCVSLVALVGSDAELLVSVAFYSVIFCILLLTWSTVGSRSRLPLKELPAHLRKLIAAVVLHSTGVHLMALVATLLHCVSLLSNSFILYEGDTLSFLLQSLLAMLALHTFRTVASRDSMVPSRDSMVPSRDSMVPSRDSMVPSRDSMVPSRDSMAPSRDSMVPSQESTVRLSNLLFVVLLPFLSLATIVRVAKAFFSCRDLQVGCTDTTLTSPLSSLPDPLAPSSVLRFTLSCVLTCALPLCLVRSIPTVPLGYLSRPLHLLVRFGLPLAGLGTCASWVLEGLLQGGSGVASPMWGRVLLPRGVCALCAGTALVCSIKPYDTSKMATWKDALPGPRAIPAVVLLAVVASLWIPITLVLNDGVALPSALMLIQAALLLWVFTKWDLQGTRWALVIIWGLMSCQYFYCLGHTPTVTSLRFEAAFTVVDGDVSGLNMLVAGFVVALNTLASQVLFAIGLPLLVLLGKDHTEPLSAQLLVISLQYTAFHFLKMMVTVFAASLHRRHLMIWGVFSPRFMYEGAFQATTDMCVLFVYALLTMGPVSHFIAYHGSCEPLHH